MGEDDGDLSMKKTSLQDRLDGDALQGVTVTAVPRWCRADPVLLRDRWPVIDRESDKAKRIGLNCPFIWRARFERYSYLHLGSTRYRKTAQKIFVHTKLTLFVTMDSLGFGLGPIKLVPDWYTLIVSREVKENWSCLGW
jgi:hypothetical protein